ncbi:RING-H2 finger protein ATL65 [Platanthera zijinensis]|uniref:RING-type E3 ubiquitin transferase n=1 Tax=Platanthera zijinensis TaxID=2320716 RepID=A0AAP0BRV3_9ASPA
MGQRSTLCTRQMFDLDIESSESCFHPDHNFFTGNTSDYANRNSHPALSGPGNSVDLFHQFRDYRERVMMYGNQSSNIQNYHAIQNPGFGAIGPLKFSNSNMLLAPTGRNFPEHLSATMNQPDNQINMDDFAHHIQLVDSNRMPCKRKDSELIPGIYYNLNETASSSSSTSHHSVNSGVPMWGPCYESGPCIMDRTAFTTQEYGGRASIPGVEGSQRSVRNRSVSGVAQQESMVPPPQNCLLPGSYMTYPFQISSSAWVSQFGNENNIGDGGFTWNYNNTLRFLHGRSLNSGPLHQANANMHGYTRNSPSPNSAMLFYPPSTPNFHPPPIHNVQVHGYSHPPQMPTPYQHPVNNLCSINSNLSGDGMDAGSTIPHFPTGIDQIYRPRHPPQSSQQLIRGSLRLLSAEELEAPTAEDAVMMDLPVFYGVENNADQHEDMRLDIDDMSYEELLALEEQIGVVKTGLSEEFIINNLKISTHVPQGTALSLEPSSRSSMENETCSICQVEYEEDEIIGTLDCGHAYHGECVKQWLLIKNLCPICKTSALATMDRR